MLFLIIFFAAAIFILGEVFSAIGALIGLAIGLLYVAVRINDSEWAQKRRRDRARRNIARREEKEKQNEQR